MSCMRACREKELEDFFRHAKASDPESTKIRYEDYTL